VFNGVGTLGALICLISRISLVSKQQIQAFGQILLNVVVDPHAGGHCIMGHCDCVTHYFVGCHDM